MVLSAFSVKLKAVPEQLITFQAHTAKLIQRITELNKGKGVTIVKGLDLDDAALKLLAAELKKKCGCGGAVKDGDIEIQGDVRDQLKTLLESKGHKVKLAGG